MLILKILTRKSIPGFDMNETPSVIDRSLGNVSESNDIYLSCKYIKQTKPELLFKRPTLLDIKPPFGLEFSRRWDGLDY